MHKATSTDDKRLQSTLKRLGVNTIPGIEEVNLFQSDGNVVHFLNPKGEWITHKIKACLVPCGGSVSFIAIKAPNIKAAQLRQILPAEIMILLQCKHP